MFEKQGGRHETQHILFEGIWLDIQARVGTPHKIQRKSLVDSWVGCAAYELCRLCSLWVGWLGNWSSDYSSTSWLHLASWNLPDSQLSLAILYNIGQIWWIFLDSVRSRLEGKNLPKICWQLFQFHEDMADIFRHYHFSQFFWKIYHSDNWCH